MNEEAAYAEMKRRLAEFKRHGINFQWDGTRMPLCVIDNGDGTITTAYRDLTTKGRA